MADDAYAFARAPTPEDLAAFPLNNLGDAKRLICLAGGVIEDDGRVNARGCILLYQIGWGWVGFNGVRWDRTYGEELARRMAHRVADVMQPLFKQLAEAHGLVKPDNIVKYLTGLGSSGSTSGMLRQAQSYLTVEIDAFDRDRMAVNCLNGTLKLMLVGEKLVRRLMPHDPADRITKVTACDYDPKSPAPLFRQTVQDSFPRPGEGDYFQRCSGYGSSGLTHEQVFFILQGKGRDGKSTLTDAIREALGDYASTGNVKTFLDQGQQNASGPTPDLARLAGDIRYVVLSEPKRGAVWAEDRLKMWTGENPVPARDLNKTEINFKARGKLFTECNVFPKPKSDDDGFWRRVKVILFRHQVPPDQVDRLLPAKLRDGELGGILNWLLDGLEAYLVQGLASPRALTDFVNQYRKQASPLSDFLDECCVWGDPAEGFWTGATDLYKAFKLWWEQRGYDTGKTPSQRAFGDFLSDRQVIGKKDRRGNMLRGPIRMKSTEERERGLEAEADEFDDAEVSAAVDARGQEPAGAGGLTGVAGLFEQGAFEPDEG